jgi:hypothetical protein
MHSTGSAFACHKINFVKRGNRQINKQVLQYTNIHILQYEYFYCLCTNIYFLYSNLLTNECTIQHFKTLLKNDTDKWQAIPMALPPIS